VLLARNFLTEYLGFLYLALGVGAAAFMAFIACSDIGRISLGHPATFETSQRSDLKTNQCLNGRSLSREARIK